MAQLKFRTEAFIKPIDGHSLQNYINKSIVWLFWDSFKTQTYRPWNTLLHQLYISRTLLTRYNICTIRFSHSMVCFLYDTICFSHDTVRFSVDTIRFLYDKIHFLYDHLVLFLYAFHTVCTLYNMSLISNNWWLFTFLEHLIHISFKVFN